MTYYDKKIENVEKEFSTNVKTGLSNDMAEELLQKYGLNKLEEKKKATLISRFIAQFKDVMIIILIIAAAISFSIACYEGHPKEFFEPVLILLIVILNAIIGVAQESKAQKALDALKDMSAPHARVIRDNKEMLINSAELVPGDIIKVEAGDYIPADARLIHSSSLKCEESALTGESVPTDKNAYAVVESKAPIGDRENMIFSGCSVTYGTGAAIVTNTGMSTEMGKIADMLDRETQTQTPLQNKLSQLGKYLGIIAVAACAIIFIVGVIDGIPVLEIFMTSVSLAVSAIPEGLPAIVTVVLSIGVQRMVKKNAIIRRLPAVETLGSASVICSDKTGTLTQNRMTLVEAYIDGKDNIEKISNKNSDQVKNLLMLGTLCSNGSISIENDKVEYIGDPTETSIIFAAHKNGMEKDKLNKKFERLAEIPFDSDRKLMTTINNISGENIVIVKGAFDVIQFKCKNGDLKKAQRINDDMSSRALRVLAIAIKKIDSIPERLSSEMLEKDLYLVGLVGMIDPPRKEAKEAVKICKKAGIKPVMITGDHIVTACAIAKELGIFDNGDKAMTGAQLDEISDDELYKIVKDVSVYARVSPENKIRIVKAWKKCGNIVSMTGDGVNDAPALKAADIGCAMGITGTDVAKGAADMTLTDDNFATIVDSIREGRGIYSNIRKVVGFLLGTNIGEILTVFIATLIWRETPLLSMQLLWINLVTDSLPAISLGMEDVEDDVMDKKPKKKDESLFAHGLGIRIILQGIMFATLTLIGYFIGVKTTSQSAGGQTMAFIVLSLSQVLHSFNMRSNKSLFKIGPFGNKKLNWSALISIILIALVVFTPVSIAFGVVYLSVNLYLIAFVLAAAPIAIMEMSKAFGLIKHGEQ